MGALTTGLELPPPHAINNRQRISANPSVADPLTDLIESPFEPVVLRALANSDHICRLGILHFDKREKWKRRVIQLGAFWAFGFAPQPQSGRRLNDKS